MAFDNTSNDNIIATGVQAQMIVCVCTCVYVCVSVCVRQLQ